VGFLLFRIDGLDPNKVNGFQSPKDECSEHKAQPRPEQLMRWPQCGDFRASRKTAWFALTKDKLTRE